MIFLASDVAKQIDTTKGASDQANEEIVQVESYKLQHSQDHPHHWGQIWDSPENGGVSSISFFVALHWFEDPLFRAICSNIRPPS